MANDNPNAQKHFNDDQIIQIIRDALNKCSLNLSKKDIDKCYDSFDSIRTKQVATLVGKRGHDYINVPVMPKYLKFHDFLGWPADMEGIDNYCRKELGIDILHETSSGVSIGYFFNSVREKLIKAGRYDGPNPPRDLEEVLELTSNKATFTVQAMKSSEQGAELNVVISGLTPDQQQQAVTFLDSYKPVREFKEIEGPATSGAKQLVVKLKTGDAAKAVFAMLTGMGVEFDSPTRIRQEIKTHTEILASLQGAQK